MVKSIQEIVSEAVELHGHERLPKVREFSQFELRDHSGSCVGIVYTRELAEAINQLTQA